VEACSSVVGCGGRRRRAVVFRLLVFPGVCGCGRSRWTSVAGCGGLSVGRGERRWRIGVRVTMELLPPPHSAEI
jgi:hypothetical protein